MAGQPKLVGPEGPHFVFYDPCEFRNRSICPAFFGAFIMYMACTGLPVDTLNRAIRSRVPEVTSQSASTTMTTSGGFCSESCAKYRTQKSSAYPLHVEPPDVAPPPQRRRPQQFAPCHRNNCPQLRSAGRPEPTVAIPNSTSS